MNAQQQQQATAALSSLCTAGKLRDLFYQRYCRSQVGSTMIEIQIGRILAKQHRAGATVVPENVREYLDSLVVQCNTQRFTFTQQPPINWG